MPLLNVMYDNGLSITVDRYRGADKSLARKERKQARKHVRDARDINNIETRTVMKFLFPCKARSRKEIHAILTGTLACTLKLVYNEIFALLGCYAVQIGSYESFRKTYWYLLQG